MTWDWNLWPFDLPTLTLPSELERLGLNNVADLGPVLVDLRFIFVLLFIFRISLKLPSPPHPWNVIPDIFIGPKDFHKIFFIPLFVWNARYPIEGPGDKGIYCLDDKF